MGSFNLGGMTFKSIFGKPETLMYPFEEKPAPAGLKGHISIDADVCILCGMCQRCCPCNAIIVEKKERTWQIDRFLCIQCGSCVRACPKSCLFMEPSYPKPSGSKSIDTVEVPDPKKKDESVPLEVIEKVEEGTVPLSV